jgi:hypothetical protein
MISSYCSGDTPRGSYAIPTVPLSHEVTRRGGGITLTVSRGGIHGRQHLVGTP